MPQINDAGATGTLPDVAVLENTSQDSQQTTFEELSLNKPILKALVKSGYTSPTPIQAGAIPHALAGRDLLLSAQTGSGKTAAFVLPILDKLSRQSRLDKHIYALILTPTRELAQQVHDNVRRYGANLRGMYSIPLVGGSPYGGQIRALRKGVQVVIATPGRLIDHMNEGRVDLSKLEVLVLDEADRMLDMGFADDIQTILQNAPESRQTVMSSATWDGAVGKIAESFTNNPEKVSIKVESGHIEESVYFCDDFHHKNKILLELLSNQEINQAVIFAATKRSTEQLTETLTEAGLKARYLHGDLPQGKRNRIISDVKNGKCDFLVATDVAARGIDISAISHVVNYDLPRQVEDYVHRIGRCGRAGRTGVAMNLCSFDDRGQLRHINRYLKRTMSEAVIEGLEPKRAPFEQEERRNKHGRDRKDNRYSHGRRSEQGYRQERQARDARPYRSERPERQDRRYDRERQDRVVNRERSFVGHEFDNQRGYYRQEHHPELQTEYRPEHRYHQERRYARPRHDGLYAYDYDDTRPKRRFDEQGREYQSDHRSSHRQEYRQDRRDEYRSERHEHKEYKDRRQTKPAKPYKATKQGVKKPKVVEEVFFSKRQDKAPKRRFGQVD
ncbi:MAG: DEAD/DEAH box helicase [Moraxella sp.]|nr:DEAD/DEAH box helicase [Moraxella sp.]